MAQPTHRPEFSPYSLVRMFWKQKLFTGIVFVVLAGVSVAVIQKLPSLYEATTLILVDSQKIPEKYVSATVSSTLQDRLTNLQQQITSTSHLQKMIDTLGLFKEERKKGNPEDIIQKMRSDITVTLVRGIENPEDKDKGATKQAAPNPMAAAAEKKIAPDAFKVAFKSTSPALAALVANQLSTLFVEENVRSRETHAEGTSDFIQQQLDEAKKSLDEQEKKVSDFKLQHSGELPEQENSMIAALGRQQAEMQANADGLNRAQQNKVLYESSLATTEAMLTSLTRSAAQAGSAGQAVTTTHYGGVVQTSKGPVRKTDQLRSDLESARLHYTDDHPEVKRLVRELAKAEETEKKEAAAPPPAVAAAAKVTTPAKGDGTSISDLSGPPALTQEIIKERDHVAALRSQLAAVNKEIEGRTATHDRVVAAINNFQARVDRLPLRVQELANLSRDYEMSKANYKSLLDKKFSADMAAEMERRQQAERFMIIESAQVPEEPVYPNRPLFDGIAIPAALFLAILAGLVREFKKNRFLGEWELPEGMPVLGRVSVIDFASARSRKNPQSFVPKSGQRTA